MNAEPMINPYASSDIRDVATLTTRERRILEFYLKYRENGPSRANLIVQYVPSWGLMGCTFAILLGLLQVLFGATAAIPALVFVSGAWLGAVLRDLGHCLRVIHYWPLHRRVLDWTAIENSLIGSVPPKPLE